MVEQPELLTTARLTLREPRAEDAPRIAALAGDFDVARMTTNIPHPYSLAEAETFLGRAAARDRDHHAVFALELEDEGVIGILGFHPKAPPAPEVGYWIGRPYWGQGYATEAASAALAWAGEGWGKRLVISGHFADNPASGRVLEKAGFLYTGVVEPRRSLARGADAATRLMVWLA
jgi:RimJ/RimL family protein N-acetyltransferase